MTAARPTRFALLPLLPALLVGGLSSGCCLKSAPENAAADGDAAQFFTQLVAAECVASSSCNLFAEYIDNECQGTTAATLQPTEAVLLGDLDAGRVVFNAAAAASCVASLANAGGCAEAAVEGNQSRTAPPPLPSIFCDDAFTGLVPNGGNWPDPAAPCEPTAHYCDPSTNTCRPLGATGATCSPRLGGFDCASGYCDSTSHCVGYCSPG